jgi:choline-sulfatase
MKKPHIVFVLSDQHNPLIMGNSGDPFIRTPNMDRLAKSGVSLASCYCPSPLCVPSRSSMLTGLLPLETGVFFNSQSLGSDQATFVHSLASAGYETVLCGRMHFKGSDQRHGYVERLIGDFSSPIIGLEARSLGDLEGTTKQRRITVERSGPGNSSVISYDKAVLEAALSYLDSYDSGKPLFLTVGLFGPHHPYVCPKDLYDYYYESLPVPKPVDEFKRTVHPAVRRWYELRDIMDLPVESVRRSRAAYYGLIELTDRYLGTLTDKVESTLGAENTLFVYGSDHGEMIGEKGLFWKTNFYEGAARVPLIFNWLGRISENRIIQQPTTLLDLGPTLIDLSGALALPGAQGKSLFRILTGEEEEDPNRIVISQLGDIKGDAPSVMIRTGKWKLVSHHGHEHPQLFNIEEDPEEVMDLGTNPDYESIRKRLLTDLKPYWDGERIKNYIELSLGHTKILAHWAEALDTSQVNEWWSDSERHNYIL